VQEIISAVLDGSSISAYEFRLTGSYQPREYCVQYRESDLNFISRLAEEEGIFYYFEHDATSHKMVFSDQSSALNSCPPAADLGYSYSREGLGDDLDAILTIERVEQVHSAKVTLEDYFFETPKNDLLADTPALADDSGEEVYSYPGKYETVAEGQRYARLLVEGRECARSIVRGTSRARVLRTGYTFTMKDHFRADMNVEYVLTTVYTEAFDNTYRSGSDGGAHGFRNTFEALPKTIPYRPPHRARKPVVHGTQTALVVGVSGEEIYVDKYGRVKVQFYWDRLGSKDENSSCWIRVAQIWAGKNWGWMTIPRIGQEVIVDFLEGDPDRPIITGRVYNADQMPVYDLPANQTQSGIKTRSSKGGGTENFNEIRFEDKMGEEMLTIHAEKDMSTWVEHDDTQKVQHNRTINVDGTHTETIVGDTTIKITEGDHSTTVDKGDQSIKVSMGDQSTSIEMGDQSTELGMGDQSTKVDLGKIEMEAMQSITLTVGGSSIKIDQMGVTIQGMMIKINGDLTTDVEAGLMLTLKGAFTFIN
jgi:type VI secretion system secreted protein VgrG